jgi:hypothetical protein
MNVLYAVYIHPYIQLQEYRSILPLLTELRAGLPYIAPEISHTNFQ